MELYKFVKMRFLRNMMLERGVLHRLFVILTEKCVYICGSDV